MLPDAQGIETVFCPYQQHLEILPELRVNSKLQFFLEALISETRFQEDRAMDMQSLNHAKDHIQQHQCEKKTLKIFTIKTKYVELPVWCMVVFR